MEKGGRAVSGKARLGGGATGIMEGIQAELEEQERAFAKRKVETRYGTFTVAHLRQAFLLVADPDNWKAPIRAKVLWRNRNAIAAAIEFHNGSKPAFSEEEDGWCTVTAEGYYSAIGP